MNKEYIGDGVYVECEYGMLRLTTERGDGMVHEIYLESEVYHALIKYVEKNRELV